MTEKDFAATVIRFFSEGSGDERDPELAAILESAGFAVPLSAAVNVRLLSAILPPETIAEVVRHSLDSPSPDLALNGVERIGSVVSARDLLVVCRNQIRLPQLLTICGSSPFLISILVRDPRYFTDLFTSNSIDCSRTETEMLAALRAITGEKPEYNNLFPILRRFKYQEMLRIAARDLNGLASLEEVTAELSALASAALQVAYEAARRQLIREHGVPLVESSSGVEEADLVIMGMGKLGGNELNFSSDIDLIYFYSSDAGETTGIDDNNSGKIPLHQFFVKLSKMITRAISELTEDGFVFRVDLGLRPEGKGGDIAVSLGYAELYYESWGQSWERSAMLKARPVAGSMKLGALALETLAPFVYRKYLDYGLLEDMMVMKKKIDSSLTREREREHNIKLGRGGIREIEFFIQALQLVFAGKKPMLRVRNSLQALNILRDTGIISAEDSRELEEAYRFLRTVEHRIQVVQQRQTHSLPTTEDEICLLARRCRFMEHDGVQTFRATLEGHRQMVSAIYSELFLSTEKRLQDSVSPEIYSFLDRRADPEQIKEMLAERGFENVQGAYDNLLVLRDGPPHGHLTERGRRLLEKLAPLFLKEVLKSPDPDMAMTNLERFLRAVGPRYSFYALLAENMELLKLIVSLFGMSQFLSKIFIVRPEILDNLVDISSPYPSTERQLSEAQLFSLLQHGEHFENRLDILRRYRHEEFLRIGMDDIHKNHDQSETAARLTRLAEVCLAAACSMARDELSRFGRPTWVDGGGRTHEAGFAVIGMGKLGGRELNYHSDLDIIYVYDHQGTTDGEHKISNHDYFARLGQKIISILSVSTQEGYVYKIDTRLRPSGNAGPLVTSLESFAEYQSREARIWERQALTKARIVVGEGSLKARIEEVIRNTAYGSSAGENVRAEIHHLRMRIEHELARETKDSYNIKTGRGGLVDVEFVVQYLQLKYGREFTPVRSVNTLEALRALSSAALIPDTDFRTLYDGYTFLRQLENRLRLIHDYSMDDLGGPAVYLDKLARHLGYGEKDHPGETLISDYRHVTDAVREVYARILGEPKV